MQIGLRLEGRLVTAQRGPARFWVACIGRFAETMLAVVLTMIKIATPLRRNAANLCHRFDQWAGSSLIGAAASWAAL